MTDHSGYPSPGLPPHGAFAGPTASGRPPEGGPPGRLHAWADDDPGPDDLDEDLLRPFVVTRGRSEPSVGLRVETQLWARPEALGRHLRFEAERIVQACRTPRSLAEVAVLLEMPLGVVRVLVGDLIADGCLVREEAGQMSIALLERIRERVLAL
ncbi:MAG TPA: DUF742 domain-containing protein [Kineosporiaceae bacterium]